MYEKILCSYHNNADLLKRNLSLLDNTLVMTNAYSFNSKQKIFNFVQWLCQNKDMVQNTLPPNTTKEHFTPI